MFLAASRRPLGAAALIPVLFGGERLSFSVL
jgi:hypothetical protein